MAQMLNGVKINGRLWAKFAEQAKRSRKDPARLLADLLRDYLDQKGREQLNTESIKAAKLSGVTQDDDIEGMIKNLRKKRLA